MTVSESAHVGALHCPRVLSKRVGLSPSVSVCLNARVHNLLELKASTLNATILRAEARDSVGRWKWQYDSCDFEIKGVGGEWTLPLTEQQNACTVLGWQAL